MPLQNFSVARNRPRRCVSRSQMSAWMRSHGESHVGRYRKIPPFCLLGEFVSMPMKKILHKWKFFLSVKEAMSLCIAYTSSILLVLFLEGTSRLETDGTRSFLDTPSEQFGADFRQLTTIFIEDLKILFGIRYWLTRPTLIIHVESVSSRNYAEAIAWLRMHKNVSCWQLVALVTVGAKTES